MLIKSFAIKAFTIMLLISVCSLYSYAQDSTRRAAAKKPAAVKSNLAKSSTAAFGTQTTNKPATNYRPPAPQPVVTDKTLRGQYQYLLSKTYNYQQPMIAAFYKNFMDTLNVERRKLKEAQGELAAQGKTIKGLQSDVSTSQQSLNESNSKADAISLLGIPVTKSTYNMIMWGLVIVFGAVAAVVIMQSGSNRREARYRIKLYEELDEEYKAYKIKANEKEKKLARELQTERNKLDELLGRG